MNNSSIDFGANFLDNETSYSENTNYWVVQVQNNVWQVVYDRVWINIEFNIMTSVKEAITGRLFTSNQLKDAWKLL
jgi:hypothetical protein